MATCLAAAAAVNVSACAKAENATPADVAMQFYVTLELSGVRDLPEPRAVMAIEPYLTPELATQLRTAYDQRIAKRRAAGATSPLADRESFPPGEGNPFSSLFEGHSSYGAKATIMRGDTALVPIGFTNTDQKPPVQWSDTLVLIKQVTPQNSWRIIDIRYGTNWEFGYQGSLTQVLRTMLAP